MNDESKNPKPSLARIVVCYATIVYCMICIIICIYGTYIIWIRRNHWMIAKRYSEYVFIINTGTILFVMNRALNTYKWCLVILSKDTPEWNAKDPMQIFEFYSTITSPYLTLYGFLFRIWHLRYDLKWTIESQSLGWRRHINDRLFNQSFYIKHKHTLGNHQFTWKYAFFPLVIVSLLLNLIPVWITDDPSLGISLLGIFGVFVSVTMYAFWKQIPGVSIYEESLYLRTEQYYVLTLLILAAVLLLIDNISTRVFDIISFKYLWISNVTTNIIWCLDFVLTVYTMTYFVVSRIKDEAYVMNLYQKQLSIRRAGSLGRSTITSSGGTTPGPPPDSRSNLGTIKLTDILANWDTYTIFMSHLMHEFSSEVLCFFFCVFVYLFLKNIKYKI